MPVFSKLELRPKVVKKPQTYTQLETEKKRDILCTLGTIQIYGSLKLKLKADTRNVNTLNWPFKLSKNHQGWKRLSRSSSQTVNPAPP